MLRMFPGALAVLLSLTLLPGVAHADAKMCAALKSFVKNKTKFTANVSKSRVIAFEKISPQHKKIFSHVSSGLKKKLASLEKGKKIKKLQIVFKKVTGCDKKASVWPGTDIFEAKKNKDKPNYDRVVLHFPFGIDIVIETVATVTYD